MRHVRLSRVVNVVRSRRLDRDIDDEQRFHVESRMDDLMREGLTREHAAAQAARHFGGRLRTRESSRDVKLLSWLESLARDVRLGLRLLRRDAGVTKAASKQGRSRPARTCSRFARRPRAPRQ